MITFFLANGTLPFSIAAALLMTLFVLELLGLMLAGTTPSHLIDSVLPDSVDASADGSAKALGLLGQGLDWLHFGRYPALVVISLLLAAFAITGYSLQWAALAFLGELMPATIASVPSAVAAVIAVRKLAPSLALLMPRDHATAVSVQELIGLHGRVTTGTARRGAAAEVAVRDLSGLTHYVMAEPSADDEHIPAGTEVLLVSRPDVRFRITRYSDPALPDTPTVLEHK